MMLTKGKKGCFSISAGSTTEILGCETSRDCYEALHDGLFLPLSANSIKKDNKFKSNRRGSFISLQPLCLCSTRWAWLVLISPTVGKKKTDIMCSMKFSIFLTFSTACHSLIKLINKYKLWGGGGRGGRGKKKIAKALLL